MTSTKDGVEFRQETVTGIDPAARRVTTDAGSYDADFLVVALGADYDIAATPGFEAGGYEYYTLAGAERLRDALADFDGGRVLVSVLGQPFKCPPAPFEGSFLLHEYFTQRGIRDSVQMTTTFPMQRPVPVTGEVAQMFRDGLAARDIEELPEHLVTGIDPATRTAQLASGETLPYDLFVGIPIHRAPDPLAASGLAVNGWVPVDQTNLRTQFPRRLRPRRRLHRPADRPQGRDLRRVGRACRRRRHRGRDLGRGATGAVRRVGRLLRRVRRRTRQQGRGQLPQRRRGGGPTIRPVARLRRREGGVRRDPASTLVRALILRYRTRATPLVGHPYGRRQENPGRRSRGHRP